MGSDESKVKKWRLTISGLLLVVTIVCVRMAVESHRYRTHRSIEIRVEVASAFEPADAGKIYSELQKVEGVLFTTFGDRFIRVRMRVHARQAVLEVLERHGIHAESVQDIF